MNPSGRQNLRGTWPRRGRVPVWLVVTLAVTFVIWEGWYLTQRYLRQIAARRGLEVMVHKQQGLRQKMQAEMASTGVVSDSTYAESVEVMRKGLAQGADLEGENGRAIKVVADFTEAGQKLMARYTELTERMEKLGPLDLGAVKSKEDLAARREIASAMAQQSGLLLAYAKSVEPTLRADLARAQVSPATIEQVIERMTRIFGKQHAIWKSSETAGRGLAEQCALLESEWGHWTALNGAPVFESDEAVRKFNTAAASVAEALKAGEAEQEKALKEIPLLQR